MTISVRRRVATNTAAQLAGKAAVLAFGAVSIAILTRYLGPSAYGRYTLAFVYTQLFGVLADVGIYTTVVRDISKDPSRTPTLVGNALALRLLLSIAMIALAAAISLLLPYDQRVRIAILIAGAPLALGMMTTGMVAVLQSRLRMGLAAIGDVTGRGVALALTILVVKLDWGFYAAVAAATGGALVTLAVTWRLTRPMVALRPRVDLAVWRPLLLRSLPLGLALAINQVYFRADTLIISLYRPFREVGFYTLAYRILELTMLLGTVFLNTTFPVVSDAVARDEPRARRAIQTSTDAMVALGLPLAAGGAILAPGIVRLAGGARFAGAVTPLQILLVAGSIATVNGIFGFALIAKERQGSALWLNATGLGFNLGVNFLVIPRYGIVAAAFVTVASELVLLSGSWWLMRRYFGFFPSGRVLPAAALATGVMAAVLLPIRHGPLVPLVALGAAVYAALFLALSSVGREALSGVLR